MASSSKRLLGLLARIAEERVARRRPATPQRPRFAHGFKTRLGDFADPEMSGGEANLLAFRFPTSLPLSLPPIRWSQVVVVTVDGKQGLAEVQTVDPIESRVTCDGIDYAEVGIGNVGGANFLTEREVRQEMIEPPTPEEKSLIDQLFPQPGA